MTSITLSTPTPTEVLPAPTSPAAVYLSSLGSERSRRTMAYALNRAASVLTAGKADAYTTPWETLRVEHMAALRARLAEQLAPSSCNLVLCSVRGVLKAARRLGLITRGHEADLAEVEPVRGSREPRGRHLEADDLRRLFRNCGRDAVGLRDAAALALLAGYGLRIGEAVSLPLDRFGRASGDLTVIGKGNKERVIPGGANAHEAINRWLEVRGDAPGPILCPVRKGGEIQIRTMDVHSLRRRITQLGEIAGVEVSPHDFRRTFAGSMIEDVDLVTVQWLLGHSNVATTAKYDRRPERTRRRAMNRVILPL